MQMQIAHLEQSRSSEENSEFELFLFSVEYRLLRKGLFMFLSPSAF